MHLVPFEFTKPKDDSAFEDMCARVYAEVFGDPLTKINGRQGQAQSGVDVFVMAGGSRFGIQCKRYADKARKFKHIEEEVGKAEKHGFDRAQVGMDRVYRMYRERLDDVAAAEAYFISLVAATDNHAEHGGDASFCSRRVISHLDRRTRASNGCHH